MLDFDPQSIAVPVGHVIGGKLVDDRGALQVRRPSDGAGYAELPVGSAALVDETVSSARHAFESSNWAHCAPRERARALRRWAELTEANRRELGNDLGRQAVEANLRFKSALIHFNGVEG